MRRHPRLVMICLTAFGLAGVAHAGEVYQWKDANGTTHYSQTPPPKGQYQLRQITDRGAGVPQQATTEQAPAAAGGDNPQCAVARSNLKTLEGGSPVHETGADGKPGRALSDSERASQVELANAAIKAYCGPAD